MRGGRKARLNRRALQRVFNTVTMNNPLLMKFEISLWSCPMNSELIWRKFGVNLSQA